MIEDALRKKFDNPERIAEIQKELKAQTDQYKLVREMPEEMRTRRNELMVERRALEKGKDQSLVDIVNQLGVEGYQKIIDDLIKEKVLARRNLKRTYFNSSLKGLGVIALSGNPLIGGLYGAVSHGRKTRRMREAAEQQAAFNTQAAIRAQARQLLMKSPKNEAAYKAAMDLMSEADYIEKLVNEKAVNAARAQNAFEFADDLLDEAGFGNLEIGGQGFRSGFGNDPRFASQIQREVSANRFASVLLRGKYDELRDGYRNEISPDYVVTDVLADPSNFAEQWAQTINRFSSPDVTNDFFNIVWSNKTVATRTRELTALLEADKDLFNTLVSDVKWEFSAGQDMQLIAHFIVKEYDGILPAEIFPEFRQKIRSGEQVDWNDVADTITDKEFAQSFRTNVEGIRADYEQFGKALHPESIDVPTTPRKKIDGMIEGLFKMFGTLPSDELARYPFFKATYDTELRRLSYSMLDEDGMLTISQNQMDNLERQAREYALEQTRDVLYELTEQS